MTGDHGGSENPVPSLPRAAPLRELTLSRLRVMLREPEVVFWVFLFPVMLAVGLGVAFSDPTPEVFTVIIEVEEGSAESGAGGEVTPLESDAPSPDDPKWVAAVLAGHPELRVLELGPEAAETALRRGEADLVFRFGPERTARFDPTRPEGRQARSLAELALRQALAPEADPGIRDEPVEQRGRRYIDWLIPGLIGLNLMSTGLWAMGFYITQMRQNRQLKRLAATPMRRTDFLLSQILARFAFLTLEVPLIILFGWLVFGVTVQGDVFSLAAVVLVGAACFSALGLLAAARARTVEGASGVINLLLLPMVVVSGVFFSPARFPDAVQPLIQALPLTALNEALRSIYNDGQTLWAVVPELGIMAGWTLATFLLALRYFRWQ